MARLFALSLLEEDSGKEEGGLGTLLDLGGSKRHRFLEFSLAGQCRGPQKNGLSGALVTRVVQSRQGFDRLTRGQLGAG